MKGLFAGADCKTPRSLPAFQSRWFTISLGSSKLRKVGRSYNTPKQFIFIILKNIFFRQWKNFFFPTGIYDCSTKWRDTCARIVFYENQYFVHQSIVFIAKKIPDVLFGGARQQRGAAFRRRLPSAPSIHWARRTRTVPRRRRLSVGNTQFADESLLSVREDGNFPPLDVEADHRGWSTLG